VVSKVIRLGEEGVAFTFVPLDSHPGDLKSKPVDKKGLHRFVEQLKSDASRAAIARIEAMLKSKLWRQNSDSAIAWEQTL